MKLRVTKGSQFSRPVRLELTKSELIFPDTTYQLAEISNFKIAGTGSRPLRILGGAFTAIGSILVLAWLPLPFIYLIFTPYFEFVYELTQIELFNPAKIDAGEFWVKVHENQNPVIAFFANFESPVRQILVALFIAYLVPYVVHPLTSRKRFHIQLETGEKIITDYMIAFHPIIYIFNYLQRLPLWVKKRSKKARMARHLGHRQ
jgi:hypothetical protein